ncbi:MAG: GIY-YIG nuclease family protein [Verrucomicrobiales bacterium]|nr:GIY-YIG nuclease family protein [Verrucomicrobiales bacterium]
MTAHAKTIQIFLPDGNPRGVKIAEFTSRTIQAVLVPRAQLDFACKRPELNNVGLYFLFGEGESSSLPTLYIGEAEDCAKRLKQHNQLKDWWNYALVCISKTQEFTKAHVKYLEWYSHQLAKKAGRYKLENGNVPVKSHISEPVIADLMDHFQSIQTLSSTLGYPLFDQIQKGTGESNQLNCNGPQAKATGEYTDDGFIVFKGSTSRKNFTNAAHGFLKNIQQALIADGVLKEHEQDSLLFTRNYLFPSPSQASSIVLASNSNGWIKWKYSNGKTLDEVKRKSS